MLSGSSVANAVTVGSLTIPAMIRLGYPRHFAGAVEAASSTGGQITPPIMGAAAFLMVEFLNLPYQTIIVAATVPAFMHFYGVFMQVHFEAKRTGLRGLTKEELPDLPRELKANWPTLIPLVLLVYILVSGSTPYLAAFTGISSAALVGLFTSRENTRPPQWVALAVGHAVLIALITGVFGDFASTCSSRCWSPSRSRTARSGSARASPEGPRRDVRDRGQSTPSPSGPPRRRWVSSSAW
jgi:TRAP-type uncharacterized transport system fused permease subunit